MKLSSRYEEKQGKKQEKKTPKNIKLSSRSEEKMIDCDAKQKIRRYILLRKN